MTNKLTNQIPAKHRNTTFSEYIVLVASQFIDDISMFPAKLHIDNQWWLIPEYYDFDSEINDIGPFSSWEDAVMFLTLRSA